MNTLDLVTKMAVASAPIVVPSLDLEAYIGVQGNVLIAVCAGSLSAIVFAKGKEPRMELFLVALASVVFGCAITSLITEVLRFRMEWNLQPKHVASLGIVIGGVMRFVWPPIIEKIPKLVDSIHIPWFGKNKGE